MDITSPHPEPGEEALKARERYAQKLFAQPCVFHTGTASYDRIPKTPWPEVALIGRSNVGKSSLMNALVQRKQMARVSHTPGRTQQLNFFLLAEQLMIVDVPGYGYAQAPQKQIAQWNQLTRRYLCERAQLRKVCVLIDMRRGIKPSDREIMTLLDEAAVCYQIVLTKSDKETQTGVEIRCKEIENIAKLHQALHPEIVITSSKNQVGLLTLRTLFAQLVYKTAPQT